MNWNKQTTFIFICVAVLLLVGIAFVMTRKSDIEAQKQPPVVASDEKPAEKATAEVAEEVAEAPAEKPAETVTAKEEPKENEAPKEAVNAPELPVDEAAAQETLKLEKSLGIKGKDALARTINFTGVPGKQMTTIIFTAQEKTYKLDIANPMLYSCKLASAVTYFKIKRAALGTKDVLNGTDVGELYVYGSDTSKAPTVCKLN